MDRSDEAIFYELLEIDEYPIFTENLYRDIFDYYGANESPDTSGANES